MRREENSRPEGKAGVGGILIRALRCLTKNADCGMISAVGAVV